MYCWFYKPAWLSITLSFYGGILINSLSLYMLLQHHRAHHQQAKVGKLQKGFLLSSLGTPAGVMYRTCLRPPKSWESMYMYSISALAVGLAGGRLARQAATACWSLQKTSNMLCKVHAAMKNDLIFQTNCPWTLFIVDPIPHMGFGSFRFSTKMPPYIDTLHLFSYMGMRMGISYQLSRQVSKVFLKFLTNLEDHVAYFKGLWGF